MEGLIRVVLALLACAVFVAIAFVEGNPLFLVFGAIFTLLFLRLGREKRRRGGEYGWSGDGDGWFDSGGDGGGD